MTVATALAVSWKPLTNSKPSAMKRATPSRRKGKIDAEWTIERSCESLVQMKAPPPSRRRPKAMAPSLPGEDFLSFWSSSEPESGRVGVWVAIRGHLSERSWGDLEDHSDNRRAIRME